MKTETVVENGFKESEIGLIPSDWETVKLGDITKISSGGSAPQGNKYFNGKNPFIRVQHIKREDDRIINWDLITNDAVKKYKLKIYPKGTIVFPKSGASIYLEKRAMLPIDAYIVSHLCAVISNDKNVNQKFLFYELRNIELSKDKADGYPTLNLSEVKNVKVIIPSLLEQQKISFVLSKIQQAIEQQDRIIETTRELKKSLMNKLFTEGLHGEEQKETEIGLMPKSWKVVDFADCLSDNKIKVGKIKQQDFKSIGKYPVVDQGQKLIAGYSNDKSKVYQGDLPIIIFGDHTRILKYIDFLFICGADGTKVILPKKELNAKFFFYTLLNIEIPSRGYNRHYHLLKEKKFPIPPLQEQKEIANILLNVDKKISQVESKKQTLQALFRTMLNQLMTGKVRVRDLDIEVKENV